MQRPEAELEELTQIYVGRGLTYYLAKQRFHMFLLDSVNQSLSAITLLIILVGGIRKVRIFWGSCSWWDQAQTLQKAQENFQILEISWQRPNPMYLGSSLKWIYSCF